MVMRKNVQRFVLCRGYLTFSWESKGRWRLTLMCPDECPNLSDLYGEEFNTLYCKYERDGRGKKTIKAQDLEAYYRISN